MRAFSLCYVMVYECKEDIRGRFVQSTYLHEGKHTWRSMDSEEAAHTHALVVPSWWCSVVLVRSYFLSDRAATQIRHYTVHTI